MSTFVFDSLSVELSHNQARLKWTCEGESYEWDCNFLTFNDFIVQLMEDELEPDPYYMCFFIDNNQIARMYFREVRILINHRFQFDAAMLQNLF